MGWRNCRASVQLAAELNALWPNRDKTSDGTVGNTAHIDAGWTSSDHNPWVVVDGEGVVRARDIDEDGIDALWLAEWLRLRGLAGDPRLAGGGYVIYEGRITTPDFTGWKPYTGPNAHSIHIHVSFSRNRAGFDSTAPWGFAEEYDQLSANAEAMIHDLWRANGAAGAAKMPLPVEKSVLSVLWRIDERLAAPPAPVEVAGLDLDALADKLADRLAARLAT